MTYGLRRLRLVLMLACLLGAGGFFSCARAAAAPPCTLYVACGQTDDPLQTMPADLLRFFSAGSGSRYYFVLPGSWDLADLRLYYTGVSTLTVDGKAVKSGDRFFPVLKKQMDVRADGRRLRLTVLQGSALPSLFIQTSSGSLEKIHRDKSVSEKGALLMRGAQGQAVYDGQLSAIRIRGNSTAKYDKKPYQIKLKQSASLLGTGKSKTYILLANTLDRSQIRNTLALDLARYCKAFSFVPAAQSVDLYINHEYMGLYLLTEKVEIGPERLAVADLEKQTKKMNPGVDFSALEPKGRLNYTPRGKKYYSLPKEPSDFTGGYLLQSNLETRYATEASGFVTRRGLAFTLQEPKYATKTQVGYISSLFQRIENALVRPDGTDVVSRKHYTQLMDLNSFVNRYLIAEVLDDFDGQRCYFYKDSDAVDSTVYVGPVWDQDNILGASLSQSNPSEIHLSNDASHPYYWFARAARRTEFSDAALYTYNRLYSPAIEILLGNRKDPWGNLRSIDQYAKEVAASAQADLIRWPGSLRNTYSNFNPGTGDTFSDQINYLKRYLVLRKTALDRFFPASGMRGLTPLPAAAAAELTPTPAPTRRPKPTATPTPGPVSYLTAEEAAQAQRLYTPYQLNASHPGVYRLRRRLKDLGYLAHARNSTDVQGYIYDAAMVKAVKDLQKANGLTPDGIASPELQALIYSDQVIAPRPAASPLPDLLSGAAGPKGAPQLPELDEAGFLPSGTNREYVFQDADDGLWYYISSRLYVEIRRYRQSDPKLVWYETRVRMQDGAGPDAIFSGGAPGSLREENPVTLARRGQAVLAISDDFYAYRADKKQKQGIIIRGGVLQADDSPKNSNLTLFPRCDVMAFLPDGSMGVYERSTVTARQLLDLGVQNSYAFGPVLIREGKEAAVARYAPALLHESKEPRCAIGMLAPNDYLILTVKGRADDSEGVGIPWLLDRFLSAGAQTAFNLDGGGTACLVFMGEILNTTPKKAREINSMIRFGTSGLVQP